MSNYMTGFVNDNSILQQFGINSISSFSEVKDFNGDGVNDILTLMQIKQTNGNTINIARFENGATHAVQTQNGVVTANGTVNGLDIKSSNAGVYSANVELDFNGNGVKDKYTTQFKYGSSLASLGPSYNKTTTDAFTNNDNDTMVIVPLYTKMKFN